MKVVIYGAAGKVGRSVCKVLATEHAMTLVDCEPIENGEGPVVMGNVNDPELFQQTVPGADALVYLPYAPYDPYPDKCTAKTGGSFDVNTRGLHDCLAAAREHNVCRVVYTSSLSVLGLAKDRCTGLSERTLASPCEVYSLTKWLGEEVCRYFSRRYGITVVVLRLCLVTESTDWAKHRNSKRQIPRTHVEDVGRAVGLSLATAFEGFQLFHIFGERANCDWPFDHAEQVLGFTPLYQ